MELPPALAYIIDSDRHGGCRIVTIGHDGKVIQIDQIAIARNRALIPRTNIYPFIHKSALHAMVVKTDRIWICKIYGKYAQIIAGSDLPVTSIHRGYMHIIGTISQPIRLDSHDQLCVMMKTDKTVYVARMGLDDSICDVMFNESLSIESSYVTCYDPSCDTHYIIRRDTRLGPLQHLVHPLMDRVKMVYVGGGDLMGASIWGNNMTIQRRFSRTEYSLTTSTASIFSRYYDLSSVRSWISDSVTLEVGIFGEEPEFLLAVIDQQTDGTTYSISSDYNIAEDRRECIIGLP